MKIISHKSINQDYYTFLNESLENSYIEGISLDVLITKDKKIVIYTPSGEYLSNINDIQKNTYSNLKNIGIILLEDILYQFVNSNKKIIINLLPIITPQRTNENIYSINKLNEEYVIEIQKIINKFPMINFYICSAYDNLVHQIKYLNTNNNYKSGFIISNLSTSYIDVDFYIFTVNVIDETIINQQLLFDKEVMIYILNCDDMSNIMKSIDQKTFNMKMNKNNLNEIYFISNYPNIFWKLFN